MMRTARDEREQAIRADVQPVTRTMRVACAPSVVCTTMPIEDLPDYRGT